MPYDDGSDGRSDYEYDRWRDDEMQRVRELEAELAGQLKAARARGDYFEVARLITKTQAHKDLVAWQAKRGVR